MLKWLDDYMSDKLDGTYKVELLSKEGAFVGSGQPMLYLTGKFSTLVEVETLLLQRLGPACVCSYECIRDGYGPSKFKFLGYGR